jgi:hypothetical protein
MTPAVWISIVALLVSGLSFLLNRRLAENSSWNTALTRVGQLYDKAADDDKLGDILREPIDLAGKNILPKFTATQKQDIWMANLFMAYEQIYVAISGARGDSKRAWLAYLKNQLNKPIIRAAFIRDAYDCDDYHQHFKDFCLGESLEGSGHLYSGGIISKEIIKAVIEAPP